MKKLIALAFVGAFALALVAWVVVQKLRTLQLQILYLLLHLLPTQQLLTQQQLIQQLLTNSVEIVTERLRDFSKPFLF
jgi:hypothetical protein